MITFPKVFVDRYDGDLGTRMVCFPCKALQVQAEHQNISVQLYVNERWYVMY